MSFYVTLVSDSSIRYFPENKISHFITQLPTPIDLNVGEWEVSLVDLIYPHSWNNIRKDNNIYGYDTGNGERLTKRIPPGCYESIPEIIKSMSLPTQRNRIEIPSLMKTMSMPTEKNKIDFSYHNITKRVKIKTTGDAKVVLYSGIAELLGFEPGEYQGTIESPRIADPMAAFPVIYVYCDIVEPQVVGDIFAPLLKIVKVEGRDGEMVNASFLRPHYVPIIRNQFQTIEVVLRTQSGDLVPFERGRVIAVLHFRIKKII